MAKKQTLDRRCLPKVITDARNSLHPTAYALQGGDARRKLDPETIELVLLKVASGMTIRQAAHEVGVAPGTIHQRRIDDPDAFGDRIRIAKEMGAETLADTVLDVALDPDLPAAQKIVIIDALKWIAKMQNRAVYGDKLAVDATHAIAPVMLPTIALPAIPEGEFSDIPDDD